jgi:hypothetical protein
MGVLSRRSQQKTKYVNKLTVPDVVVKLTEAMEIVV